ncbi:SDR family oxidoreductase [Ruficoccus sp. ZRK36]|uniref:SDR family oxidoreductase n=1 Tax=Ruficoccus sp. ZRK36 TaxID=2866311 RepID=UPI001C72AB53|nr:SDR family oxidoreductase [Ruficoccus sp. ZRK36]QYY35045.1 SDR family oxidoreductase [Ruficoccus sp. ZRK36]
MTDKSKTIALVTGASDGIGKEVARQLATKGIHVLLGSRSLEKGQGVVDEFKQKGLEVELLQLDISDDSSVENAVAQVNHRHGRLDILVNNAGIFFDKCPLTELPVEDLAATFNTNVVGTFRVTRSFLPLLRKSEHARIVNVSSGLGSLQHMTDENSPYYQVVMPSYASSKAALNVLTVYLARELKDSGIKVNSVCPGMTATRYVDSPFAHPVEVGAEIPVRYALIDDDGPTGGFFDRNGPHKW